MRMVVLVLAWAATAAGQTPAPVFDVASVKVSAGRGGGSPLLGDNIHTTPGSLTMQHVTLKACIQWAYRVFEYQVSGGPNSIDSDHYDIAAKAADPAGEAELRVMLQALLADRFQLSFHRQSKEMQALVLSVGKNGPKFHESKTEGESVIVPDQKTLSIAVRAVPVSDLVNPLSRIFQMPVVDKTGLTGRYDVALNIGKFLPQNGEKMDPLSMIQTGLQEELGLKLEPKKLALDLLIIDHAAKTPTGN
jgi:uncharacterized protein (TIGR03435 family)